MTINREAWSTNDGLLSKVKSMWGSPEVAKNDLNLNDFGQMWGVCGRLWSGYDRSWGDCGWPCLDLLCILIWAEASSSRFSRDHHTSIPWARGSLDLQKDWNRSRALVWSWSWRWLQRNVMVSAKKNRLSFLYPYLKMLPFFFYSSAFKEGDPERHVEAASLFLAQPLIFHHLDVEEFVATDLEDRRREKSFHVK